MAPFPAVITRIGFSKPAKNFRTARILEFPRLLPSRNVQTAGRLWKSFHKRNYEQFGIRQSLTPAMRDFRRCALDMADRATPLVFA
jgi:hypothetical protein